MFHEVQQVDHRESNGFHLVGHVTTNYDALVQKLGRPNDPGIRGKVTAGWCVRFGADIFTVYDNVPEHGLRAREVRSSRDLEWHIGGKEPRSLDRFIEFLRGASGS